LYKSRKFGELELTVAEPRGEVERRKFAHYLWNAGVLVAELVGGRVRENEGEGRDSGIWVRGSKEDLNDVEEGWGSKRWWVSDEEERLWRVNGETVLELGAGWRRTFGDHQCISWS